MKIFGRTGGYYLFWSGFIYLTIGMVDVFWLEEDYTIPIQIAWIIVMVLPLVYKPLARWLNMRTIWEQ